MIIFVEENFTKINNICHEKTNIYIYIGVNIFKDWIGERSFKLNARI